MTGPMPPAAAVYVAVGLLRMVGGTDADAYHLAAAIDRHRRDMRLEGAAVPVSLIELERVFAAVAVGPRQVTEDHDGSEIGDPVAQPDSGPMPDLLTRGQTAKRLRCSVSTIKRRELDGELTPIRHGRIVRHRRADVDNYLNGSSPDADD